LVSGLIAVHAIRGIKNRPEQIGGFCQIFESKLEKQLLTGLPGLHLRAGRLIVEPGVADGVIEDARIRCESADSQFTDAAFERTANEQPPRNVVEPEALTHVMQLSGGFHSR
jgi:hypothetical protein